MLAGCIGGDNAAGLVLFLQSIGSKLVLYISLSLGNYTDILPDTWFLVGMAARLALGLGLHSSSTYVGIPVDIAQSRKRLFFSVYMMDRSV